MGLFKLGKPFMLKSMLFPGGGHRQAREEPGGRQEDRGGAGSQSACAHYRAFIY